MGPIQHAGKHCQGSIWLCRAWKFGSREEVAGLIVTAPLLPHFWPCGGPCKLDDAALWGKYPWLRELLVSLIAIDNCTVLV